MPKFNVTLRRNLHGINSTQEIQVEATDGDAAFLVAAAEVQADFPTAICDHISSELLPEETTPSAAAIKTKELPSSGFQTAPEPEKKKTATVPKKNKGTKNG